jgi:hypothetical protein
LNSSRRSRDAGDVDPIDQHPDCDSQPINAGRLTPAVLTNQPPANLAGNFQSQLSTEPAGNDAGQPQARMSVPLLLTHRYAQYTVAARAGFTGSSLLAVSFAHRQKENQWLKS